MSITLTFTAGSSEELLDQLQMFAASCGPRDTVFQSTLTEVASHDGSHQYSGRMPLAPSSALSEANPKPTLSVEDLRAGMKLKETASSSLPDGTRIAPGDTVLFGGEEWHVYHTYRGRIIAGTEDNRFDVISTDDCEAVPSEDQPLARPRPGTAAAHTQPDPNQRPADQARAIGAPEVGSGSGPVDPAYASKLRELATAAVSQDKVSVDAVYAKLGELGSVSSIDALTAGNAILFDEWLTAATAPKPKF